MSDQDAFSKRINWEVGYSDFISSGKWDDVDEVLKPIYEEVSNAVGREFKYPEKGDNG